MYAFIHGPLIWISFLVFILGILYQVICFFCLTGRKEMVFVPLPSAPDKPPQKKWPERIRDSLVRLREMTLWKTDPAMTAATFMFHIFLFLIPPFLLGHTILLDEAWGINLWGFPESFADGLTWIPILCGAFFLSRRLFVRKVQAVTTAYDYVALFITIAPFLTGTFAYHQYFDYETTIFLHILSGEVMLITVPFTKLGHMLFFFLYRFFIGSEYSFGRGTRDW